MARITADQMDNYGDNNSSEWLKLQNDGDVARVQFLYKDYNDFTDIFACHKVQIDGKDRYVDCKRDYDSPIDDCPFCAAGIKVSPVMMLTMYDHTDDKIKIWERGKVFRKKMEALFNRYPNLSEMVFEIERRGAKGDKKTTYEIFPMPNVEPVDVSQMERPEFIGGFILDKTPDEMLTYLNTGEFPNTDNNANNNVTRRNFEQESAPVSRRGASRRVQG